MDKMNHEANQKLIDEFSKLYGKRKGFSIKGNNNELIFIDTSSTDSLNKVLKYKFKEKGKLFMQVYIDLHKELDIKKILNMLKKYNKIVSLFYFDFLFNANENIEEQTESFLKIFSFFNQPGKNKLMINFTKKKDSSTFNEVVLNSLNTLYSSEYEIIYLNWVFRYSILGLKKEWKSLTEQIKIKRDMVKVIFNVIEADGDLKIDTAVHLARIVGGDSKIIIDSRNMKGMLYCSSVKKCEIQIDTVERYSYYYGKDDRICFQTKLSNLRNKLIKLNGVREMIFIDIKNEDISKVVNILFDVLPYIPNVVDIQINSKEIKKVNARGIKIYHKYLKSRQKDYLSILIKEREKGRYNRGKVMVMGDGEAGKSSTVRSLSGEIFNPKHLQTIVAATADVVDFQANNWKKMGDNRNNSISTFQRDLKFISASVVRERANPRSRATIPLETENLITLPAIDATSKLFRKALEENEKTDRRDSVSNEHELETDDLVSRLKKIENPLKLTVWDFGGQRVFDALHILYLTDGSIYYVVFNLRKFVDNIEAEAIKLKRWLSSLALFAPNGFIFLIGTRADNVDEEEMKRIDEKLDRLAEQFDELQFELNGDGSSWFFPVENSAGAKNEIYLKPIKQQVQKILVDEKSKGSWNQEIELSWMFFMHHIFSQQQRLVSLDSVVAEGVSCGFKPEEVKDMLSFFNSVGTILDYSNLFEEDTSKPSIVMDPHWLLEVLGDIIMAPTSPKLRTIAVTKKDGSRSYANILRDTGFISSTLLKNLVESFDTTESELSFITALCEKKLIIARVPDLPKSIKLKKKLKERGDTFWIVPSFFSKEVRGDELTLIDQIRGKGKSRLFQRKEILWGDIVPPSLFESFICSVVNFGVKQENFTLFSLNGNFLVAEMSKNRFEIEYFAQSIYFLNIYSRDEDITKAVTSLVKLSYSALCDLDYKEDISEEWDVENPEDEAPLSIRKPINPIEEIKDDDSWDCFLSHCWRGAHEQVVELAPQLEEEGLKVWLDENDMEGDDIFLNMQEGIVKSRVFVAFITEEYLKASSQPNSNAGKEFRFAAAVYLERILLVVLDEKLTNPNTWNEYLVRFHAPGALYVDMSTEEKRKENLPVLVSRIRAIIKKNKKKL